MVVQGVFKADLRVTSKEKALEFYKGVKSVILIPCSKDYRIRVEPGQQISLISARDVDSGFAPFVPALHDPDGSTAYRYRKYINAYLNGLN